MKRFKNHESTRAARRRLLLTVIDLQQALRDLLPI